MEKTFVDQKKENKVETKNQKIDWSEVLRKYETPTIFKEELLKPCIEKLDFEEPILDAGCGNGYFSQLLCQKGYRVFGIDLNSQLESNAKFTFQKTDLIKFKTTKKFSTVLLVNVLTTISPAERLEMLKKIKELKTGEGKAYIVNTNAELFGSKITSETLSVHKIDENKVRLKLKLVNGEYIEFDDYVISHEEMKNLCQKAGLEIIEAKKLVSDLQKKPVYIVYLLK